MYFYSKVFKAARWIISCCIKFSKIFSYASFLLLPISLAISFLIAMQRNIKQNSIRNIFLVVWLYLEQCFSDDGVNLGCMFCLEITGLPLECCPCLTKGSKSSWMWRREVLYGQKAQPVEQKSAGNSSTYSHLLNLWDLGMSIPKAQGTRGLGVVLPLHFLSVSCTCNPDNFCLIPQCFLAFKGQKYQKYWNDGLFLTKLSSRPAWWVLRKQHLHQRKKKMLSKNDSLFGLI